MRDKPIKYKTAVLAREAGFKYGLVRRYYNEDAELNIVDEREYTLYAAPFISELRSWMARELKLNLVIESKKINGENRYCYDMYNTVLFDDFYDALEFAMIKLLTKYLYESTSNG